MLSSNKYIYDYEKSQEYSDFQFISSWENNYKSWKSQKEFPIKIIKYEDLLAETFAVFTDIIEFINKTTNNNEKINKRKIKNSIASTSFHKLQQNEKKMVFLSLYPRERERNRYPSFF